jgi:hypothetical protein
VVKTALIALCAFTLLATAFLSLSLVILQPPRANVRQWFLMAALIVAQGALTLAVVAGRRPGDRMRWLLVPGAAAVMWLGATWAYATVHGSHFEGYALVLGSVLVVQGAVTLAYLTPRLFRATQGVRGVRL